MGEHKKQIAIGAVLSYTQIVIGALVTLFFTPLMIRILGKSEYGLYGTVSSVIASLSILSLGFGSSYVRFYSKYRAEENKKAVAELNGMFMTIFSIIGFISLICGLFLSNNLEAVFDKGLTQTELDTARVLMIILTVNLSISFPASVFSSIITANEKFIFQKSLALIKQIMSPLVCIPLLFLGYASTGMVIGTVGVNLFIEITNIVFCFKTLRVKFIFHVYKKDTFRELIAYSGFIALNMIVDQINLNIDKFLLGRYCGTGSVAVYNAGYTLFIYYHYFSTSISNVFSPRIHHIWNDVKMTVTEKNRKMSKLFASIGRIQFIVLWLVCSGMILFGRQFIMKWAGIGYDNAYYVVTLLSISSIVPLSQNLGIEIQRAKNKHQFRSILYAAMAVINLALSIYLCQIYGEIGSALGTAVSFLIVNTIIMNIYYNKAMDIKIGIYWKYCIKVLASSIPAIVIGVCQCVYMDTYNLGAMVISIFTYSLAYAICMFFILLDKNEREMMKIKLIRK